MEWEKPSVERSEVSVRLSAALAEAAAERRAAAAAAAAEVEEEGQAVAAAEVGVQEAEALLEEVVEVLVAARAPEVLMRERAPV